METVSDSIKEVTDNILDIVSKCVKCRFCFTECPVYEVSDRWTVNGSSGITQSLYYGLKFDQIDEDLRDILMRCTTCGSCEIICERIMAGVKLVDAIRAGRFVLMDHEVPLIREQQKALEALQVSGNPYRMPPSKRTEWADSLKVPKIENGSNPNTLYFVGCTASYDQRVQDVARSISKIMQAGQVPFAIMGNEKCSGDPAFQMGETGLFEMLKEENAEAFRKAGIATIVTTSPHDFDCFKNHYSQDLDNIQVIHYTELFLELMDQRKISFGVDKTPSKVTFHDPCYLGKHNSLIEAPRKILNAIPGMELVEMNRSGRQSLCCGGGGGRMWAEYAEQPRLAELRVQEALETGAEVLVTACPFCLVNFEDAIKTLDKENRICVKDLAEVVIESAVVS